MIIEFSDTFKTGVMTLVIGLGFGWLTKDMIVESIMSRRAKRGVWKKEKEKFEDGASFLLQTLENTKQISAGGIDRIKRDLARAGYKDIGMEPSFGKPWYRGPAKFPDVSKLKSQIKGRLGRTWRTSLELLRLRRRQQEPKKDTSFDYLKAMKRKAS